MSTTARDIPAASATAANPSSRSSATDLKSPTDASSVYKADVESQQGSEKESTTIIGAGTIKFEGKKQPILITQTVPTEQSNSTTTTASATQSSTIKKDDASSSNSVDVTKVYLLNATSAATDASTSSSSSSAPDLPSTSQLAPPLNPLLAPLDVVRPQAPMATIEAASSSAPATLAAAAPSAAANAFLSTSQPNILSDWSSIAPRLQGKQLVIFLDYDGTLTPIVSQPSEAKIDDKQRERVIALAKKFPVAIVTGRKLDTIQSFMQGGNGSTAGLENIYYAASHGFDIRCPVKASGSNKSVADSYLPKLREFKEKATKELQGIKGILVEDNKFSISVHYRNVNEKEHAQVANIVDRLAEPYVNGGELRKCMGKMVFEIRPQIDWHKGAAVNYLMPLMVAQIEEITATATTTASNAAGSGATSVIHPSVARDSIVPVYMGDDITDEDAFLLLRSYQSTGSYQNTVSIHVTPEASKEKKQERRESAAEFVLNSTQQVGELLEKLIKDI